MIAGCKTPPATSSRSRTCSPCSSRLARWLPSRIGRTRNLGVDAPTGVNERYGDVSATNIPDSFTKLVKLRLPRPFIVPIASRKFEQVLLNRSVTEVFDLV
jgi:hypothetical protein